MSQGIMVTVRDGRVGRDPNLATPDGLGEILKVYETNEPPSVGDRIPLPDGTEGQVIGLDERLGLDGWSITAFVGNV